MIHTALGVAAVAAVIEQTGIDALVISGSATNDAANAGLSWVYDITQSITEAGGGIERVKAEALPLIAGLATTGLLSADAQVC